MAESYNTIADVSDGFYKDRGSKFYAFAYHVSTVEAVKPIIDELKKQYYDARHHCFAYVIGTEPDVKLRANDDGEPNHSAGDPILGQIKSYGLTDTLVVVVRYFGGTKLGVGGLVQAYRESAGEALKSARIITKYIKQDFRFTYPYDKTNEVLRITNEFEVEITDQQFTDICEMHGRITPSSFPAFKAKLALLDVEVIVVK